MNMEDAVNTIVNEYCKFNDLFTENLGYDLDDYEEHYKIWLKGISEKIAQEIGKS